MSKGDLCCSRWPLVTCYVVEQTYLRWRARNSAVRVRLRPTHAIYVSYEFVSVRSHDGAKVRLLHLAGESTGNVAGRVPG